MRKSAGTSIFLSICEEAEYFTTFIDGVFLMFSVIAIILNVIVWISLAHRLHITRTKKFKEIRRSFNRRYLHFRAKKQDTRGEICTKSLKFKAGIIESKRIDKLFCDFSAHEGDSSEIFRSPSCPNVIHSESSSKEYCNDEISKFPTPRLPNLSNKWINTPPHRRPRLKTAIYLVYCLNVADILTATLTMIRLIFSLKPTWHSSSEIHDTNPREMPSWPCMKLLSSCLQFTAHNAAQLCFTGLVLDMYQGISHPMNCYIIPEKRLLKYIILGWIFALLCGSNQLIMPSYSVAEYVFENKTNGYNNNILRHFLLPSEPCLGVNSFSEASIRSFCYAHGSGNMYRSGFITGGIVLVCSISINVMCVISLRKIRYQEKIRTPMGPGIYFQNRCTSLPAIGSRSEVIFSLNKNKTKAQSQNPKRFTSRQLIKNFLALISLVFIFILLFLPSFVLEVVSLMRNSPPQNEQTQYNFAPWMYNIISNLPVISCIMNPIIYSLRLYDVRQGLQIFKNRIQKIIRKPLLYNRSQIRRNQRFKIKSLLCV